jgi:hypothetical protein
LIAPVKAVGHHPMFPGRRAGGHVCLNGARDGWKAGDQDGMAATGEKPREIRHRGQISGPQIRNRKQRDKS